MKISSFDVTVAFSCLNPRLQEPRKVLGSSFSGFQFPNPDVAVAHGMVVVLERERKLIGPWFVWRTRMVRGRTGEFDVVLHQHAIVKNGFARGTCELSCRVKARRS